MSVCAYRGVCACKGGGCVRVLDGGSVCACKWKERCVVCIIKVITIASVTPILGGT